jgi:hypothetical protein
MKKILFIFLVILFFISIFLGYYSQNIGKLFALLIMIGSFVLLDILAWKWINEKTTTSSWSKKLFIGSLIFFGLGIIISLFTSLLNPLYYLLLPLTDNNAAQGFTAYFSIILRINTIVSLIFIFKIKQQYKQKARIYTSIMIFALTILYLLMSFLDPAKWSF